MTTDIKLIDCIEANQTAIKELAKEIQGIRKDLQDVRGMAIWARENILNLQPYDEDEHS